MPYNTEEKNILSFQYFGSLQLQRSHSLDIYIFKKMFYDRYGCTPQVFMERPSLVVSE